MRGAYLGKMLIRIPSLLILAACTTACASIPLSPDDASISLSPEPAPDPGPPPTRSPRDAFCDHRLYRCMPNDPGAQKVCDYACLLPSYCQDYMPGDYQWCSNHPDTFDRYSRYCDPWGDPAWDTFCVVGSRP